MGKVVQLPTKIPPKSETYEHAGQKYRCTYDPNAPSNKKWVWNVDFICIFKYFGSSPTLEAAARAARLKIHSLVKETEIAEESSD